MKYLQMVAKKVSLPLLKHVLIILLVFTSQLYADDGAPSGNTSTSTNLFVQPIDYSITNPSLFSERIDPFSRSLVVAHQDLLIPGNGGLDITINRSYTTPEFFYKSAITKKVHRMGEGWDIHFGYIFQPSWSNKTALTGWTRMKTRSGSQISACYFDNRTFNNLNDVFYNPTLVTPDGNQDYLLNDLGSDYSFTTKNGWRGGCGTTGYIMYSPQGYKYTFNQIKYTGKQTNINTASYAWYPSRIEDKHGNWISISYRSDEQALINQLISSDGRRVNFGYSTIGGHLTLTSITSNNQTIYYHYTNSRLLEKVTLGSRTLWRYSYTTLRFSNLLSSIITEAQGRIDYVWQSSYLNGTVSNVAVIKTRSTSGTLPAGTTTYRTLNALTSWNNYLQVEEVDANKCIKYEFNTYLQYKNWLDGTIRSKAVYQNPDCVTNLIEKETNEWDRVKISSQNYNKPHNFPDLDANPMIRDGATFITVLKKRTLLRQGTLYTTEYSNFTQFGQARNIREYSSQQSSGAIYAERNQQFSFAQAPITYGLEPLTSERIVSTANSVVSESLYYYDAYYNLIESSIDGQISRFSYDNQGNLYSKENGNGHWTNYSNYYRGKPRSIIDAIGSSSVTVDYFGNTTSETDESGITTTYQYTDINRLTAIYPPLGTSVYYQYNATQYDIIYGNYKATTTFDGYNRPVLITERDTAKNLVRYQNTKYDIYGNTIFTSIYSGSSGETQGITRTFDALGRLTRLKTPLGNSGYVYLANTPQIEITDARNYKGRHTYRSYGSPNYDNIIAMQHPSSSGDILTQIERDPAGRILSVTQDGQLIRYQYHNTYKNLPVTIIYPQFTHYFTYDAAGNTTSKRIGNGVTTYFHYDARNRLAQIDYPAGTNDVTRTYSPTNKLLSASNGIGNWAFNYDINGRMTQRSLSSGGQTFTFNYGYDQQSNLNQISYPGNITVDYTPDAFGQATKAGNYASAVLHHPQGNLSSFTYGNSLKYALSLHSNKVMIGDITSTSGSTVVLRKIYNYDANGNVINITDPVRSTHTISSFSYDGIDRLIQANSPVWGGTVSFAYDKMGNITRQTMPQETKTYYYNGSRQLTSISSALSSQSFSYDSRGNVVNNGYHNLSFNQAEQLIQAQGNNATRTYRYDALGKRVQIVNPATGATEFEVYDDEDRLLLTRSSSGELTRKIYLGNKLIAQDKNGQRRYSHFDVLGSVIALSDANRNLVIEHYHPYGKKLINPSGTDNNQWYTGKQFDSFLSLSYHGARYYDPAIGRFISNDPLGYRDVYSFNRYAYANNNPYKYTDPDGRSPRSAAMRMLKDPVRTARQAGSEIRQTLGQIGVLPPVPMRAEGVPEELTDIPVGTGPDSPSITPSDIAGKSPGEIDQIAKGRGLIPKGPNPQAGKGSYIDPKTGKQRILIHPDASCGAHCHVNNSNGERLDENGNVVAPESPEAHLPIDTTKKDN